MDVDKIYLGNCLDVLKTFEDNTIDCCITSPPYWNLRDYGCEDQLGLEPDFNTYIQKLTDIFIQVKRVLKPSGTLFINMGDTYGTKSGNMGSGNPDPKYKHIKTMDVKQPNIHLHKCLLMIPERFSIKMIDEGYTLRNEIIWHKPNQMPHSAKDRFTNDFEKIFFFVKKPMGYYFKQQLEVAFGYDGRNKIEYEGGRKDRSIGKHKRWSHFKNLQDNYQKPDTIHVKRMEGYKDKIYPERNMRTVWSVNTYPCLESHFATFPDKLVSIMVNSGCPENGIILDPFMGSGTTGIVANKLGRHYVGIELNEKYKNMAERRIKQERGLFV